MDWLDEDSISDPERAAALAAAIRQQRAVGNLALLTGDPVLGRFGQAQLQQVGGREQLQAQRGEGRLTRAMQLERDKAQRAFEEGQQGRAFGQQRSLRGMDLAAEHEKFLAAQTAAEKKRNQEGTEGLRKELMGNPVTKSAFEVKTAMDKIKAVATGTPSAAGDLALVFSFMKLNDPGSSVRESEQADARNAAGVPEQVRNIWNRVLAGERLAPAQRQDFFNRSGQLAQAHFGAYSQLKGQYVSLAEKQGLDPAGVGLDLGFEAPPAAATRTPAQYMVSPDKKQRQPVYEDGTTGPVEPNPGG